MSYTLDGRSVDAIRADHRKLGRIPTPGETPPGLDRRPDERLTIASFALPEAASITWGGKWDWSSGHYTGDPIGPERGWLSVGPCTRLRYDETGGHDTVPGSGQYPDTETLYWPLDGLSGPNAVQGVTLHGHQAAPFRPGQIVRAVCRVGEVDRWEIIDAPISVAGVVTTFDRSSQTVVVRRNSYASTGGWTSSVASFQRQNSVIDGPTEGSAPHPGEIRCKPIDGWDTQITPSGGEHTSAWSSWPRGLEVRATYQHGVWYAVPTHAVHWAVLTEDGTIFGDSRSRGRLLGRNYGASESEGLVLIGHTIQMTSGKTVAVYRHQGRWLAIREWPT